MPSHVGHWGGVLFLVGLGAGFVDSIAGGGGLISLPALLWTGLPPGLALGTNKAQSSVGTSLAVWRYHQANLIDWDKLKLVIPLTFLSALLGAEVVTHLSNETLRHLLPWVLLLVALYAIFNPQLGTETRVARLQSKTFGIIFGCLLGFYDGFFGPGTGAFWTLALVTLAGYALPQAVATTKVVNLASNLGSLLLFICRGQVILPALMMMAGQLIGAELGTRMVILHGAKFVRYVFIAVVLAMIVPLVFK